MARVILEKIEKAFGGVRVLSNIDLVVEDGQFVTLVGPSGCGKSTLLNIVAGLEAPSSGVVRIDGEVVNLRTPQERGVAMVFQSYALYPHMSARKNIAFPLEVARVDRAEIAARVQEIADRLGIGDLLDRRPRDLSGGQRQRVALGRALVRKPRLCLFDEPLSNLDANLRADTRLEIKRLHEQLGATFLYVTHDQVEAMTLADRVIVLDRGVVRQIGAPLDVYRRPADMFVARFFGAPSMNLVRPSTLGVAGAGADDVSTVLGIRPEDIAVRGSDYPSETPARERVIPARVEVVEPAGAATWVTARASGESITARAANANLPRTGDEVRLCFDPGNVIAFDRASGRAREVAPSNVA